MEFLPAAVMLFDALGQVLVMNMVSEDLLETLRKRLLGRSFARWAGAAGGERAGRWVSRALASVLLVALGPCARASSPTPGPNVLLVFLDTLRADHVACYGYRRRTSPTIDALAREGTLFENAFSQATWSLPSYASTFTSLYPAEHGVDSNLSSLSPRWHTLASILAIHGYETCAFVGGGHLLPDYGLNNGFTRYESPRVLTSIAVAASRAIRWLGERSSRPFFLLLHGYDVHAPYSPPLGFGEMFDPDYRGIVHAPGFLDERVLMSIAEGAFAPCLLSPSRAAPAPDAGAVPGIDPPGWMRGPLGMPLSLPHLRYVLTEADRAHVIAHYDGAAAWADLALARVLDALVQRGLLENTIVIVAGDHGEHLFEGGRLGHGGPPELETIHVPLVMRGPGIARGRRIRDAASLIDLAPTLLALLGITPCEQFHGESLAAYLAPQSPPPAEPARAAFSWAEPFCSIWSGGWHLIEFAPDNVPARTRLFHTDDDPSEARELSAREPQRLRELKDRLDGWREEYRMPASAPAAGVTSGTLEMFRRFGYW